MKTTLSRLLTLVFVTLVATYTSADMATTSATFGVQEPKLVAEFKLPANLLTSEQPQEFLAENLLMAPTSAFMAETKPQVRDPRIGQQEMLALIGMDPANVSYKTDYEKYDTGVLLVPSSGPISGSKGWYKGLAVPAGALVDIPKDAKRKAVSFTAQNGQKTDAMEISMHAGEEAIVNACGNHHRPEEVMVMKMLEPLLEIREVVKEVVKEAAAAATASNPGNVDPGKMAGHSLRDGLLYTGGGFAIAALVKHVVIPLFDHHHKKKGKPGTGDTGGAFDYLYAR